MSFFKVQSKFWELKNSFLKLVFVFKSLPMKDEKDCKEIVKRQTIKNQVYIKRGLIFSSFSIM